MVVAIRLKWKHFSFFIQIFFAGRVVERKQNLKNNKKYGAWLMWLCMLMSVQIFFSLPCDLRF
jgi:hypothetical protein